MTALIVPMFSTNTCTLEQKVFHKPESLKSLAFICNQSSYFEKLNFVGDYLFAPTQDACANSFSLVLTIIQFAAFLCTFYLSYNYIIPRHFTSWAWACSISSN